MTQGIDYSSTQSAAVHACFHDAGIAFVCRYYDASGGKSAKCLDRNEADALLAAGLQIFTVYETVPTEVGYFTKGQGSFDALAAKGAAAAAGQPSSHPIFFAVDYDASDADLGGAITDYFNGVDEAMAHAYPLGLYGSYRSCAFARANWPAVPHLWQTYAWSNGQKLTGVDLYQYQNDQSLCGVDVDLDEAAVPGWMAGEEEEMTPEQVRQIAMAAVKDYITNVYGPSLEAELRKLHGDTVADAVKAVAAKLTPA